MTPTLASLPGSRTPSRPIAATRRRSSKRRAARSSEMTTRVAVFMTLLGVLTTAVPCAAKPAHKAPAEEKVVLEEDEDAESEAETAPAEEEGEKPQEKGDSEKP